MNNDYLYKIRCPESGYLVADCGCLYCFDEFEMDADYDYGDDDNPEDWEEIEEYDE